MGAGFRGSSPLFQSAPEFLKTSKNETLPALSMSQEPAHNEEEQERNPEMKRSKTSPSVSSSSSSPNKRSGKVLSKKQQKLAEAAKNSHCISQYFGKKITDDTPKNGEATVLEPEEMCVFVETPPNRSVVLNSNTETQHDHAMDAESTEKNSRPVENQTMDVIPMDKSATEVETHRTEEATQSFEERTVLEAEGYDHVTSLNLFSVEFLFLCSIFDNVELSGMFSVCFVLLYTLAIGGSHSLMPKYNQKG